MKIFAALIYLLTFSTAFALEAGPLILAGKVAGSNEKMVTLDLGNDQIAEVPMKLAPKHRMKNGKFENGTKLAIALTEEQTKQIKIHKK